MPVDPERHRDAQRRYKSRLAEAAAPGTADLQRAISVAVKQACTQDVKIEQKLLLGWIVRQAAKNLIDAGFSTSEVYQRLQRALQPAVVTQIDGQCQRVDDANHEQDQDAAVNCGPAMGM